MRDQHEALMLKLPRIGLYLTKSLCWDAVQSERFIELCSCPKSIHLQRRSEGDLAMVGISTILIATSPSRRASLAFL